MGQSRIELLEKYHEEEPGDPFNIYALALEYEKSDRSKAQMMYSALLEDHSDYLPAYYKAAHFYMSQQNYDKAKIIFEKGIRIAVDQNKSKILQELRTAYQNLKYELGEL